MIEHIEQGESLREIATPTRRAHRSTRPPATVESVRLDRSDGIGGDVLDLVPVEEAHLGLVAARRLQAEDALVDEVAALRQSRGPRSDIS